jgi:hypothetical protein
MSFSITLQWAKIAETVGRICFRNFLQGTLQQQAQALSAYTNEPILFIAPVWAGICCWFQDSLMLRR